MQAHKLIADTQVNKRMIMAAPLAKPMNSMDSRWLCVEWEFIDIRIGLWTIGSLSCIDTLGLRALFLLMNDLLARGLDGLYEDGVYW